MRYKTDTRKIFNVETREMIYKLRDQGWTYQMLANEFNCAKGTARRYCTVYRKGIAP